MSTGKSNDINVTPLIDVLLVLLVIFVVITPTMMKLEQVQLPPIDNSALPELPIVVKLRADLTVAIDDDPPAPGIPAIAERIRPKLRVASVVFVDFDESVVWSDVVNTVDAIRSLAHDENHDSVPIAVRIRAEDDPGDR